MVTLDQITENHVTNAYFSIGPYSYIFAHFAEDGYTPSNDRPSHEQWILFTKDLSNYFPQFVEDGYAWSNDRRSYEEWILFTKDLLNYFCSVHAGWLDLSKWPKITWGMNTFQDCPSQVFLLTSRKRVTLDQMTEDHMRNEYFSIEPYSTIFAHFS